MSKNDKLLPVSFFLLVLSLAIWQLGDSIGAPDEMDRGTSLAVTGFSGTVFFLFTTLLLAFITMMAEKVKPH